MIAGNSCSPGCKMSLLQTNRPPYFCVAMQCLPQSNTIISAGTFGVCLLLQGPWSISVVFKSPSCTHRWIPAAFWTDCHCCVQMTPNYNHLASNEIVLAWLHPNLIASAGSEEIKKRTISVSSIRVVSGPCIHSVSLNLVATEVVSFQNIQTV